MDVPGFQGLEGAMFWPGLLDLQVSQVLHSVTTQAAIQPRARDIQVQERTDDSQKTVERDRQQSCAAPRRRPPGLASTSPATDAACGCDPRRCRACATCRRSARSPRSVSQEPSLRHRCAEWPLEPSGASSLVCEDVSAWSLPVAKFPRYRSCHEQGQAPRRNVIIRDGTHNKVI